MSNPVGVHWIPVHVGEIGGLHDREWFKRQGPAFVKIITNDETVPHIEDVPAGAKLIIRNYPLSEQGHDRGFAVRLAGLEDARLTQEGSRRDYLVSGPGAFAEVLRREVWLEGMHSVPEAVGAEHAATCNRIAQWCAGRGVGKERLLFEGLNEPMLWSTEPPDVVARYYAAFLKGLHGFGLRGVCGNFGVGWPGNGGVQDAPVDWAPFRPMIDAMIDGDYLGLHEYWALEGAGQNWRWWAGRFTQCPYEVPILITECGIDTGVTGQFYGGWANLPGQMTERARRYVGELAWYWQQCRADGRVQAIFPFTYDRGSDTWVHFDHRNEDLLREVTSRVAEFPAPEPFVWNAPSNPRPPIDPFWTALKAAFGGQVVDVRGVLKVNGSYAKRSEASIERIIVHHTAAASSVTWAAVARYHVDSRGWPGIAYHLGITPDGGLSYLGSIDTVRYHAGTANSDSIGICFAGNFETDQPTPAALATFSKLRGVLADYLGRELSVVGHRDVSETACPGKHLYDALFGVAAPSLEGLILAEGAKHDMVTTQAQFALCAALLEDGLLPVSDEYEVTHAGVVYVGRVARGPDGQAWAYYCRKGQWDQVMAVRY
jgi:hypothetical protein